MTKKVISFLGEEVAPHLPIRDPTTGCSSSCWKYNLATFHLMKMNWKLYAKYYIITQIDLHGVLVYQ
jgi:hypothetical protein